VLGSPPPRSLSEEKHGHEDRRIPQGQEDRCGLRLLKRTARKSEDAAKKKEGLAAKKPRTGRPVTNRAFSAAIAGKQIAGAQKTRILRAVNHILTQKKQDVVELSALFENTARPVKKVEKKAE
jgi:hypothetical protein